MDEQRYRQIIQLGIEEPNVDFKRAMSWKDDECQRLELLKHIAAMSTYGGGILIIGRDDDDKSRGSLTEEQMRSFEVTKVNEILRNWVRPIGSVRVVPIEVDGDRLIVLDVPGFDHTPPCFQEASSCANQVHRDIRRHFSKGDVYIRTAAAQTARVADPQDWQTIWNQILHNVRGATTFGSAETPDDNPYDAEDNQDVQAEHAILAVPFTTGTINISVRPVKYIGDRVPRMKLRSTLTSCAVGMRTSQGTVQAMPYERGGKFYQFSNGLSIENHNPQWGFGEAAILHTSGNFRLRRIFFEDLKDGTIQQAERSLPIVGHAIDLTLAWSLAARIAGLVAADPSEVFDVAITVTGLQVRTLVDDSTKYGARVPLTLIVGPGHQGTESTIRVTRRLDATTLNQTQRELAVETYQEVLWVFGIEVPVTTVAGVQASLTIATLILTRFRGEKRLGHQAA